jgi:hypothetical protein
MQAARDGIKRLIQIAAISMAVAVVAMAAMFAFSILVFGQGQSGVRAALERAIDDGSINVTGRVAPWSLLPLGQRSGWPMYMHECLIWSSLIVPGMDAKALSLRTAGVRPAERDIDKRAPANPDCQAVLQILRPTAGQPQPTPFPYDRYIMAQRALAQLLLSHLSVNTSRILIQTATYAAFLIALVLAWRRRAIAAAVVSAMLLLFYGLSFYSGAIYFAALDITHAIFIIAAVLMPLGTASIMACAVAGALYGAYVAQFEILSGGIPLGLAIIALLVGSTAPHARAFVRNTSTIVMAFCAAIVFCFAIKLGVASLAEGANLFAQHTPALFRRLRGSIYRETPPQLLKLYAEYAEYPLGQIAYLIRIYYPWSRLIGWGSSVFGAILVASGLVALIYSTVRVAMLRRAAGMHMPPQLLGCWLGIGFLIIWVAIFWNHTLIHPFFMGRILVIPVMCGAVALVALRETLSRSGPSIARESAGSHA